MLRITATAFFILVTPLHALAEKRVALVMGADDYKTIRPLSNAVNDALSIEKTLENLGFEVTLESNRDLKRMRRALEDFREDAAGADVALVFFAGHGVEISGQNFLLPTDAAAHTVDALRSSAMPLDEIRAVVAEIGKVGIIMLDACRNDPLGGGSADGTSRGAMVVEEPQAQLDVRPGLGRMGRAENVLFAFSAAPGATASDGQGPNSPFTTALAKYLGTDGLEIRSALTLVQQEVYDQSRGNQLPYIENGLPKLFFAATTADKLPERERLLLAMADVTPDLRDEIERLALEKDMPLAPLYGALISSDAKDLTLEQRTRKLADAADAFVTTRNQMRTLSSTDPAVTKLRQEAEQQLALGAFDTARGKLAAAATIDSTSRDALKANFLERTLSEATTHAISGGASRADLKYDLAIASYEQATALYGEVSREALPDEQREQQLQTLNDLGDLYVTVGDLAKARKAFEAGQAAATHLADAQPDGRTWSHQLALSTLKLGDVLRDQGDSNGALAAYEHGLSLRRKLAQAHPADGAARGLEAAAYLKVGALHKLQGNPQMALASYEASRDIVKGLVASDAANDDWETTLARSHRLIGELQQEGKKLPEALQSYQASLDLARKLADARPDDALRQFDLASAYEAMGAIQFDEARAHKQYSEDGAKPALTSLESAAAIIKRLIAADPKNTAWQRGFAGVLERIGETTYFGDNLITKEDAEKSLAAYKAANEIRQTLVNADPTNKLWVADLVTSYERMATWYEFVPDDVTAIGYSKKAHEAVLKLASLDPENVEWQRNATLYHTKLAGSYVQLKDYANALTYDQAGLDYAIKVAEAHPDKQVYQSDVIVFHGRVAFDKSKLNDWQGFFAQNDLKLEAAKAFNKRFPDNTNSLRDLHQAYMDVANSYTKNFPQDALKLFEAAKKQAVKASGLEPENPEFLYDIYKAEINSGYVLEEQGDRKGAKEAYEAALAMIERAVALKPNEVTYTASRDHALARIGGVRD
ncbi:peptidase C14 [Nordella sp. HKS 07]|uniref:caspase family protein n=1 Tax=Nordella sp. HKS 07 TaxID=2712222 RepID=UPI0013E16E95|nr:caspase family protein [Nordella sp. HKS 07]QIG49540.1 peptidase C14 [Nordella sp. HKS 07]